MALADDLLSQARHLAEMDEGKPKQANLRRAVSSAYYAVFHLFISEAVRSLLPGRQQGLIDRVSRTFNHADMQKVCKQFREPTPPTVLANLVPSPTNPSIRAVASLFAELQDARHSADYDLSVRYTRTSALAHVQGAETAFATWKSIRATEDASVFLAALTFGTRWSR